jgi:D-alanyl-D-alanine carboxypeptidase
VNQLPSKRLFQFFALLLLSQFLLPQMAKASPAALQVRSALLVDASTGAVLFEQNADAPIPPASITKVLTLYLVYEAIRAGRAQWSDKVLVSRLAANAPPTRMGLKAGERVPLGELIKGAAIASGNDAAIALAEHVGGSLPRFITMMNLKAKKLGMT